MNCIRNMGKSCCCELCQNGDYNPEDYIVDIAKFSDPKKMGVSGLMRVKNEQDTVAISIDSCVEALDELIICYQDCSDNTPQILERKRQQYPDKIKLFHYKPHLFAHNLTKEEYDYALNLPDDSIHLLSNYYNYTLSKATYRHALKIDADQIYFSERLRHICAAYRVQNATKMSFLERWVFRNFFRLINRRKKRFFASLLIGERKIMNTFENGLCKFIAEKKPTLALSGINLCKRDGKYAVPYATNPDDPVYLFNGVSDTVLFKISEKTYYISFKNYKGSYSHTNTDANNSFYLLELFQFDDQNRQQSPLLWYHLKFALDRFSDLKMDSIPYDEFRTSSLKKIVKQGKFCCPDFLRNTFLTLYKYDRSYPDIDTVFNHPNATKSSKFRPEYSQNSKKSNYRNHLKK